MKIVLIYLYMITTEVYSIDLFSCLLINFIAADNHPNLLSAWQLCEKVVEIGKCEQSLHALLF